MNKQKKKQKLYFDKEKKLKITAALLVALSGILAGIVELFSNCGCCCGNVIDRDICPVKIALLVVNVVAVLTALAADIIGIIEYGKKDEIEAAGFTYDKEDLTNIEDTYGDENKTLKVITETQKKDTSTRDKEMRKQNRIFLCSLITTAFSVFLLCVSVVVLAVI